MIAPFVVAISYSCIGKFSVFSMESKKTSKFMDLQIVFLIGINLAIVTWRVRNDDIS